MPDLTRPLEGVRRNDTRKPIVNTQPALSDLGKAVTKQPFSPFGFELNVPSALGTAFDVVSKSNIAPVISAVGALGNIQNEFKAREVVNPQQNYFSTIAKGLMPSAIVGKSNIDIIRERADLDKNNIVTPQEYNLYEQNFIKGNVPTPNVNVTRLDPLDSNRAGVVGLYETQTPQTTFTPKVATSNIANFRQPPMGVGTTGDLGGATGAGYGSGFSSLFGDKGESEGLDTKNAAATRGQDVVVGKSMNVLPTGTSFADDAQMADTGDAPTYICTALYEMGDMKKYVYKYDQMYGSRVNPATYRGYTLWGEYLAKRIRNKGIMYKIVKPVALAWAYQMANDLSKGKVGKSKLPMKLLKKLGEGICFILGKTIKRSL